MRANPQHKNHIAMLTEIQENENKLAKLKAEQARYKAINDWYRKWQKNPKCLASSGLSEKEIEFITTWVPKYSYEKAPIESWRLTNLNATIKNTEKRIETLQQREAEAEAADGENKEFAFTSGDNLGVAFPAGKVIWNYDEDRLQIEFDEKPSSSMIEKLKSRGYKWSYTNSVWQRQLTENAKGDAQYMLKFGQWSADAVAESKEKEDARIALERSNYQTA